MGFLFMTAMGQKKSVWCKYHYPFQLFLITDPDLYHTHFAPAGLDAAGHMLEVIVIEKDTLQVIDDDIDGPVGSIPHFPVVGPSGGGDPNVNMGLFKIRDTDFCLLGNGFVDHPGPVFFHDSAQFLQPRKWFRYHQADDSTRISLGDRHFSDRSSGRRAEVYHIVHHAKDMAAKPQRLLVRLFQHLEGNPSILGQILLNPLQSLVQIDKHGYSPPLLR